MSKHVSIIFCGGCNPRINRKIIAEKVQEHLALAGCRVTHNCPEADYVIFLSGCTASCAERKFEIEAPSVAVAGSSINSIACEEQDVATEILAIRRSDFEKLQRKL